MPPRSAADSQDGSIEQLVEKVGDVEQELAALRHTLQEIRDDIAWWVKNNQRDEWLPIQPITSMPADPLAPDWAERVNKFSAADPPEKVAGRTPQHRHLSGRPKAIPPALDDEMQFCCDAPDLQWTGDPQFPGIACANCGYMAVDCGSVVMPPPPEESEPLPATESAAQQELF